jgi:hypothetical protein
MPKIRDLGINVIPETARPLEIGWGGGCVPTHCAQSYDYRVPTQSPYCPAPPYTYPPHCTPSHHDCVTISRFTPSPGCQQPYGAYPEDITQSPVCPQWYGDAVTRTPPSPGCDPGHAYSGGGLTREAIGQLKAQLYQQIEQLNEYEKNIGPKTKEAIDAREKELKAELEDLARRRKDLDK